MDVIEVATQRRRQLVDITSFVQRSVAAGEVAEGMCHVFIPHTTAAVLINENADPDVGDDILAALAAMLPGVRWKHAEGNSDAHLMATLVGASALELRRKSVEDGMINLRQSGLQKIRDGVTTIEEVVRETMK